MRSYSLNVNNQRPHEYLRNSIRERGNSLTSSSTAKKILRSYSSLSFSFSIFTQDLLTETGHSTLDEAAGRMATSSYLRSVKQGYCDEMKQPLKERPAEKACFSVTFLSDLRSQIQHGK
uniref:Uncharacterized protein n=1 Tax=Lepeophtheirus salmonis TaxID=72036 RepID=A0A0K2TRC9_LEPSM